MFFGLIAVVLGGGLSDCGQLNSNFLSLLQVGEGKIERFLEHINCKYFGKNVGMMLKSLFNL